MKEDIDHDAPDEVVTRQIEILKSKRELIAEKLRQIKSILRKNKLFVNIFMI